MTIVVFILVVFVLLQLLVHCESTSLGQTRKQRREAAKAQEKNRLFWHIRDLEKECLEIDWNGNPEYLEEWKRREG
jgi:hypothetical protein